jgi:hypothetical protein
MVRATDWKLVARIHVRANVKLMWLGNIMFQLTSLPVSLSWMLHVVDINKGKLLVHA